MERERRSSRRLAFEHQNLPRLSVTLAGRGVEAKVLNLSKAGVRIAVSAEDAVLFRPGTELTNSLLVLPSGSEHKLPLLSIVEKRNDANGNQILRVQTADEPTRASLWFSMEAFRDGEKEQRRAPVTIKKGDLPKVPARGIYNEQARIERLAFAMELSGTALDHMRETSLVAEKLTGNIEALIGGVEIPVGLAGPLFFVGKKAKGFICAPYATTEGALVASATRGATAITRAGGVTTRVISQHMMRVPLFVLNDMRAAFLFASWIRDHLQEIRARVQRVSKHAKLISAEPHVLGNMVNVTFLYETGDAAGQNMTTACTWHACQWLMDQMKHFDTIKFETFIIEANMSGDKKVTFQSFINGRGTRVTAECFLPDEILEDVLKVTAEQLVKTNQGIMAGSLQVGMVGYNINIANTIAAIFTATGQDIACVHESAIGQLHIQAVDGGIYASLLLPSLIVGTVGGGTHLPRQRELLSMMDCSGPGKMSRFAEIIAGFSLALDLSTVSAVASGQFASAHDRLGRNRPVNWFAREDLKPAFFEPGLRRALNDEHLQVLAATPVEDATLGSSIITELTARKVQKLVGLYPYQLRYGSAGHEHTTDVIVKVKPLDGEVILMANSTAAMCGPKLASEHSKVKERTGFAGCHLRELGIYQQTDARMTDHMPRAFETHRDDDREAYVLVLEHLKDVVLLDSADDIKGWGRREIEAALRGAAQFHSVWYGREEELKKQWWLGGYQTTASMTEMIPLWEALGVHAGEEFPEWVSEKDLALHRRLVHSIPDWWSRLESLPRTLVHNDFNPRNICLRKVDGELRLCAYDWELATLHLPQHDLAELLCFVLKPDVVVDEVDHYVEFHRSVLEAATGQPIDPKQWRDGFRHCLYDLVVNRVAMYVMAHTFRHYGFMERVVRTLRKLIRIEKY